METTGILNKYAYKYDLHVHTFPVSPCAHISPEETVDFYTELGYNGFVLTNHFNIDVMGSFKEKNEFVSYWLNDYHLACEQGKKRGTDVFLGMEIKFPENTNDYLIYGLDEGDIESAFDYIYGNYENFYKGFKKSSNIIIQAHPLRDSAILQRLELLDGIEVFNMHPNHNSRIGVAAKLAHENPQLLVTGGTDFHYANHQGMCAICTREKLHNSFDVAKLITSRDYIFDIWGNKIII